MDSVQHLFNETLNGTARGRQLFLRKFARAVSSAVATVASTPVVQAVVDFGESVVDWTVGAFDTIRTFFEDMAAWINQAGQDIANWAANLSQGLQDALDDFTLANLLLE